MEPSSKYSLWDTLSKLVAVPVVLLGGFWGLLQFYSSSDREIHKPLWDKRLELYEKASKAVATIAVSEDGLHRRAAIDDFWVLYFGPLVIVEDRAVESTMVRIGNCLSVKKCTNPELQQLSLELSAACKESIAKNSRDSMSAFLEDYKDRVAKLGKVKREGDR